jgi:hypothetical protein
MNLMETHFNIQRRLFDDQFSLSKSPAELEHSHSRRRRMLLKINDLSHSVFVNIKPIESITYMFYAVRNAASL